MRRWDSLVGKFIGFLETRGLSAGCIDSRRREMELWGNWLKRRKPLIDLERVGFPQAVGYLKTRAQFRAKTTVASIISHLRSVGDFLVREGIWKANPLRWLKGPKIDPRSRLPRRLPPESLEKLIQAGLQSHVRYYRYLWSATLSLLYATGLRRGELDRLNLSDWSGAESTIRIDGRKTGVERVVPVGEVVWRALEAYLPQRHNILEKAGRLDEPALFVNKRGQRLSGDSISCALFKLARKAGVTLVTLHQFRHSCASDLLESGVQLPFVQKMLGHVCVDSTMRYLAISDPERRRAMACHPINEILAVQGEGQP